MNSTNQLYKKVGIIIGIVAVLAVFIVTFAEEKSTPSTVSDSSNTTVQSTDVSVQGTSQSTSQNDDAETSDNSSTVPVTTTQTTARTQSQPQKSVQTQTPPPVTTTKKYSYKNGTYTANGAYGTPEGQVAINVTLTITNDVITDANVTSASGDRTSVRYQNKFISGYKQYVVGKSVDSVQLSNVSGSSLTPDGFNNALASIKVQARA